MRGLRRGGDHRARTRSSEGIAFHDAAEVRTSDDAQVRPARRPRRARRAGGGGRRRGPWPLSTSAPKLSVAAPSTTTKAPPTTTLDWGVEDFPPASCRYSK